jgi:hypothetical protein
MRSKMRAMPRRARARGAACKRHALFTRVEGDAFTVARSCGAENVDERRTSGGSMRKPTAARVAVTGWVAGALWTASGPARAQTASCDALVPPGSSVLYVAGPSTNEGSGVLPLVQVVASALSAWSSFIYQPAPPCSAIQALASNTPGNTAALYLDPAGGTTACTADAAAPDLAVSDIFPGTCVANSGVPALTATEQDFLGPVQTSTFVTPTSSSEKVISADAAYVVFGFGASNYVVSPWSDPASIFVPNPLSGPLNVIGATLGLSPTEWVGAANSTLTNTSNLTKALKADATPSAAIGILPGTVASQTTGIRVLAYQHSSQQCGFLPDSDSTHFDKINVRQGRYELWGPTHFIVRVDSAGTVLDSTGQPSAVLLAGLDALAASGPSALQTSPGTDSGVYPEGDAGKPAIDPAMFIQSVAVASFIPWCAMQVLRASDGAAEASYQPPGPCDCYFESNVGATTSLCPTCASNTDCTGIATVCRYGYCEIE